METESENNDSAKIYLMHRIRTHILRDDFGGWNADFQSVKTTKNQELRREIETNGDNSETVA